MYCCETTPYNHLSNGSCFKMTNVQCRMARAALGWSINDLASIAGVNFSTIRRFEGGTNIHDRSRTKIETALVGGGVVFFGRAGRVCVSVQEQN